MRKSGIFDRLVERVRQDCNVNIDRSSLERTRAGYWQRSRGAWLWFGWTDNRNQIGSIFTATEIVKAKKISVDREGYGTGLEVWVDEK